MGLSNVHPAPLTERVRRRVIAFFKRQGFLNAHAAAAMLAWENSGFSIDASVRITLNRPRHAELFSVARASPAVLCPAPLRTRAALRDPRRRQPHRSHPLCDAQAQGGQLGRARQKAGEKFPLQCPACGGDIRLRGDGRRHPTSCLRSTSTRCEPGIICRLILEYGEGLHRGRKTTASEGTPGPGTAPPTGPPGTTQRPAGAHPQFTGRKMLAEVPLAGLSFYPSRHCCWASSSLPYTGAVRSTEWTGTSSGAS